MYGEQVHYIREEEQQVCKWCGTSPCSLSECFRSTRLCYMIQNEIEKERRGEERRGEERRGEERRGEERRGEERKGWDKMTESSPYLHFSLLAFLINNYFFFFAYLIFPNPVWLPSCLSTFHSRVYWTVQQYTPLHLFEQLQLSLILWLRSICFTLFGI